MSTLKIWDLHMTHQGPLSKEAAEGIRQLAESIAREPGVIWKIWTVEPQTGHFGSTYLFKDLTALEAYKAMHLPRLEAVGVTDIKDYVFDIMEDLSAITRAPLQG